MANNFEHYEEAALEAITGDLTTRFYRHAIEAGWPSNIVKSVSVVYDNASVGFDYPANLEEIIDGLEFGSHDQPPSPAMRTFKNRVGEDIYDAMEDAVCNFLYDNEVLA